MFKWSSYTRPIKVNLVTRSLEITVLDQQWANLTTKLVQSGAK